MADDERGGHAKPSVPPLLVFVHVPKTAGTAFTAVLESNEARSRISMAGNVFKGRGGIDRGPLERLREPEFVRMLAKSSILRGHLPFGVREYLPGDRRIRYLTFLRDPVDRMLSHFFYVRDTRRRGEPRRLPAKATLDDAISAGVAHDNLHTRMLSGLPEPFGKVTVEMLERAKRNLREEFLVFGLAERFEESLVLIKQRLGLPTIVYPPADRARRVNVNRPRGTDVPERLRRVAERHNRHDIELYRFATELFESAPERQQLEFAVDLAALRVAQSDTAKGKHDIAMAPPTFAPSSTAVGSEREADGRQEAWRMLVESRSSVLVLEAKLRKRGSAARPPITQSAVARSATSTSGAEGEPARKDRAGRARPTRRDATASSSSGNDTTSEGPSRLEQIDAAIEVARIRLEGSRTKIADLEAADGARDASAQPEAPAGIEKLRQGVRELKERIEELEQQRRRLAHGDGSSGARSSMTRPRDEDAVRTPSRPAEPKSGRPSERGRRGERARPAAESTGPRGEPTTGETLEDAGTHPRKRKKADASRRSEESIESLNGQLHVIGDALAAARRRLPKLRAQVADIEAAALLLSEDGSAGSIQVELEELRGTSREVEEWIEALEAREQDVKRRIAATGADPADARGSKDAPDSEPGPRSAPGSKRVRRA